MIYVLSIGTNMGNRLENLQDCINALNRTPKTKVMSASAVYETEPCGLLEQNSFYNACLLVDSQFDPHEMLGICLGIESAFGRIRTIKNGPRVLDVDIIFAENKNICSNNLILPHPGFSERRFVLQPLADIFTDFAAFGIDFKKFLEKVSDQKVNKVDILKI